ncbi:MAG: hypothetical protein Tsb0021_05790 [Chlamydiales bacterium]
MSTSIWLKLKEKVAVFLEENVQSIQPLCIALSGGPDSLCLLYLIHECQENASWSIHIAHVDHGWRQESAKEAEQLANMASKLHIPFHFKRLEPPKSNWEDNARRERIQFFNSLQEQYQFQAFLFAHHYDDQSETILKRIFEGSTFLSGLGMKNRSKLQNLTIWRPLLDIPKKEILSALEEKGLIPFEDPTNLKGKNLRAIFRSTLIPFLEKHFNKQIHHPLNRIAGQSKEIHQYLTEKTEHIPLYFGKLGAICDFSKGELPHPVEIKFVLNRLCQRLNITLSSTHLEHALSLIIKGSANKKISTGKRFIFIDRKRVFYLFPFNLDKLPQTSGENHSNQLGRIIRHHCSNQECLTKSYSLDWMRFIVEGKNEILLPPENYTVKMLTSHDRLIHSNLEFGEWIRNEKVPHCLMESLPGIINREGYVVGDFFSGKSQFRFLQTNEHIHYCLSFE